MSEVRIVLPATLNTFTLRGVISDFVDKCQNGLPDKVIIDFGFLGFIHPSGVTFLSNFVHWLHHRGLRCDFYQHTRNGQAHRFLDDSLFFEQHLGNKLNVYRGPRRTTQHLRRVEHAESHYFIRGTLGPWLADALNTNNASLYPFQVCLSEIFNNIQDHSDRDNGSIFAQHFPNINLVRIAIADFGRGIPHNVANVVPDISHNEAIIKAVEAGFSTKSTPRNRGAGLDYLLQTVVGTNGGEVTISSFNGMVRFLPMGGGCRPTPVLTAGFCPGTTIDIELRTDTIIPVEDEPEDLEW
ncbi:hypothetical protein [Methylobacterium haplocladii]|uniref:hypothetical protein n=1 Tax=Methylobacterium haplocladii TaxID=1176176 RepID=UPI0014794F29|nr:hypothetical protein [Methylobacterium haplocladii]GJD85756.1 hypothetical protein HPGCJGGD_3648 [Methylobacterium haplocladii]